MRAFPNSVFAGSVTMEKRVSSSRRLRTASRGSVCVEKKSSDSAMLPIFSASRSWKHIISFVSCVCEWPKHVSRL